MGVWDFTPDNPWVRPRALTVGGSTFVGIGDIFPGAIAYYSMFAYDAASIGNPIIELRRDSNDDLETFLSTSTGLVDVAAISSWAGGANLFIRTWFDGSGNGADSIQTTDADQFEFSLTGFSGTLPALINDGSPKNMFGAIPIGNLGFTVTGVGARTDLVSTANNGISTFPGGGCGLIFRRADIAQASLALPTNLEIGTGDADPHAYVGLGNGDATSVINQDGSEVTGDAGDRFPGKFSGPDEFHVANDGIGGNFLVGYIGEAGVWYTGADGTQRTDMVNNMMSRWGL